MEHLLPYLPPLIEVSFVELEQVIAGSLALDSPPSSSVVDDYADGGSEWGSGDISF